MFLLLLVVVHVSKPEKQFNPFKDPGAWNPLTQIRSFSLSLSKILYKQNLIPNTRPLIWKMVVAGKNIDCHWNRAIFRTKADVKELYLLKNDLKQLIGGLQRQMSRIDGLNQGMGGSR